MQGDVPGAPSLNKALARTDSLGYRVIANGENTEHLSGSFNHTRRLFGAGSVFA